VSKIEEIPADMPPWARFIWIWFGGVIMVVAIYSACALVTWLLGYGELPGFLFGLGAGIVLYIWRLCRL
jgi:hypothetical protein